MAVGMKFNHFAHPKPPSPNFEITVPSRISARRGSFKLIFYVPLSYFDGNSDQRFPVVVNFHGGGFTLGTGTDDARWASSVIQQTGAIVVSVAYRLAPEYPFSVGVEDGTDALIYLASHAEDLTLDSHRIAISGFSAGGNFAFTVPLMMHDLQCNAGKRTLHNNSKLVRPPTGPQAQSSCTRVALSYSSSLPGLPKPCASRFMGLCHSTIRLMDLEPTELELSLKVPDLRIVCIVSFYPLVDFRHSRDNKRLTNPQPATNLSKKLTNLFDQSYIPQVGFDLADPYLSPAAASDDLLAAAYPNDIVLYTCEYDMLNEEGVKFGERLGGIGKAVHGGLIKAMPHAFDKKPNPISFPTSADLCYAEACAELNRVFGGKRLADGRTQLQGDLTAVRFEGEMDSGAVPGDGLTKEYGRRKGEM